MKKEKNLNFSIDRLTIIGDLLNENAFVSIYYDFKHIEEVYLCCHADSSMFECSYNIEGLGYVQIDNPTKKIRIDFNPNKITLRGKHILNYLLQKTKNIHYSRLDLAIDLFNYNISEYNIIDIGNRKSAFFYDRVGKLETIYSGSMKSNKYIRIYNKAVEQKLKNMDWWRFEIQLRDVYIDKYLSEITDFYKDILVYKYSSVEQYSIEENAMIEYLLHDISRINKLSKNSRSKYKKIIRSLEITSLDFFDSMLNLASEKVLNYLNYLSDYALYPDKIVF